MCPDCRVPLVGFELGPVEIDRCVDCGGTWLDAGELEAIVRFSGAARSGFSAAVATDAAVDHEPATRRRCPRCRRRLRRHPVGDGAGRVEAERCPVSHGLWLDRGEMETIVMRGAHDEGGAVARFFSELYRGDRAPAPEGE